MSYSDFLGIVASGRKNVSTAQENVMPAFGANQNVMCYIDDIYVYLRARANDAVPRGRPAKHEDKPEAADQGRNELHRTMQHGSHDVAWLTRRAGRSDRVGDSAAWRVHRRIAQDPEPATFRSS